MKKTITILAAAALMAIPTLHAQKKTVLDISESITDNAIVFPESFETDSHKLLESWYVKNYTSANLDDATSSSDPGASDEVIKKRLKAMPCIIEMPFNQIVKSYIERYTIKGRQQVSAILGLGTYYIPIFEQALEEQGLPLELKYLPVIESALDPNAISRHGATGLWQFMIGTAKGMGMEVSSLVDERRDPYVSSEKAASYLKDLYAAYGDWSLAIAAYNCGPSVVNKALRRAGGDASKLDFWNIYNYLPAETRGYVPMFIAANYVMTYYPEHNIGAVLPTKPLITDTVAVAERIHFNQISEVLDIPVEELRLLNPQFRADIIPGTVDRQYFLILPSQQVHAYIMSESDIRRHDADKYARRDEVEPTNGPVDTEVTDLIADEADISARDLELVQNSAAQNVNAKSTNKKTLTHTVLAGETISDIATKYGVTAAAIKTENRLRRAAVREGQQLKITTTADVAESVAQASTATVPAKSVASAEPTAPKKKDTAANNQANNKKKETKKSQPTNHKIKSGENLSAIANKYGVSVADLRKANNLKGDNIRAGETLTIPAKGSAKSGKSGSKGSKKSKKKRH